MAIREDSEILSALKNVIGDRSDDEVLSLLEDVTDTLASRTAPAGDGTDWKARYDENDAMWRQKYRDRFYNGESDGEDYQNGQDTVVEIQGEDTAIDEPRWDDLFE